MPASTCLRTMSSTCRARSDSSIGLPLAKCSRTACRIWGGRGKLPVWVVRIRVITCSPLQSVLLQLEFAHRRRRLLVGFGEDLRQLIGRGRERHGARLL